MSDKRSKGYEHCIIWATAAVCFPESKGRCSGMYETVKILLDIAFVVVAAVAIFSAIKKKKK